MGEVRWKFDKVGGDVEMLMPLKGFGIGSGGLGREVVMARGD